MGGGGGGAAVVAGGERAPEVAADGAFGLDYRLGGGC